MTEKEIRKLERIDVINKVWARFDTYHDFGKINEELTEKCMSIFDDNNFNELSITKIKKELETQFGTSQFGQKLVADVCKHLKPSKKYSNAIDKAQAATTQHTKSSNILCTNLDIGYSNHKNRFFKRDDFEGKATCYLELLCNFDQNDDLVPQCWTQNIVPIIECGELEGIKNTNPEINGCTIVLKGEVFNGIHGKEPNKKNETSTLIKEYIFKCLIVPTTNPNALAFIEDAHTHPFFLEDTERKCQNTRSWDSQSAGCNNSISQLDPAKTSSDAPEFEKVLYALQSINFDPTSGNVTLTRKANNGSATATATAFIQGEKYCKNFNTISSCDKFPRERHQLMDCIPQDGKGQNSCVTWITNTGVTYDANPAVYFDIKRSGDSFQALTAKYYVDDDEKDRYPIFITMDKLACMKARMIGVTTILTHPKNNKSCEIAFTLFPSYQYKPHKPIAPRFERLKEVKQPKTKEQQDSESSKSASETRYENRNKLKEQSKQAKDREERLKIRGRVKAKEAAEEAKKKAIEEEKAKKKAMEEEEALKKEEIKQLETLKTNTIWFSFFTVISTFSERFTNTFTTLKDFLLPSNFSNPTIHSIFKKYFMPITPIGGSEQRQQYGGDPLSKFMISTSSPSSINIDLLNFYIDKYVNTTYVIESIFLTEHLKWFNRNGIASLDIYNDQTLNKYEFILDIPDWIEQRSGKTPTSYVFSEDEYIQESIKSDYDNIINTINDLIEAYNKLIAVQTLKPYTPIIAQYLVDDIHKLCLDFYREKISLMAIEKISSKSDAGELQESLFAALTELSFPKTILQTDQQKIDEVTTENNLLTHILPEVGTLELFDMDMQTSEEVAFNNVFFKYQNEHNLREFVRLKIDYAKQLEVWNKLSQIGGGGQAQAQTPDMTNKRPRDSTTEFLPVGKVPRTTIDIDSIIESKENREIDSALLLYVNLWIIDIAVKEDEERGRAQGGATYTKGASSRHPKKTAYPPFHPQTKTMLLHRFLKKKVAIV